MELVGPLKAGSGYEALRRTIEGKMANKEPSAIDFRIAPA